MVVSHTVRMSALPFETNRLATLLHKGAMAESKSFEFAGQSVSNSYDTVLVPLLFEAWAERLLETLPPESSWSVLDLATGTGIVAEKIARRLAGAGSVVGVDVSAEMLALAKRRCSKYEKVAHFHQGPADSLPMVDGTVDAIYCQQGFQFFPDKHAAAREMRRVLRPDGKVAVSAWCPVEQCDLFGLICSALRQCDEAEIAQMMALPFDHMPADQLADCFSDAGFGNVEIETCTMPLVFPDGVEQAMGAVFATPIGPRLAALPPDKQARFRDLVLGELEKLIGNGPSAGTMTSLVLTAERA